MPELSEPKPEELLIDVVLRLISGAKHVAIGANSPIPAAAAFLAQRLGGGRPYVSLQQSAKHNLFTDGGRELFDAAGQRRIDRVFLSGGRIAGQGDINLVAGGGHARPEARLSRSRGRARRPFAVPPRCRVPPRAL